MATRIDLSLPEDPDDVPVSPYRPVPEDHGVGGWLRGIAGVKEDILEWVPEERPRYARLGAIILNTGCMAALSLLAALEKFFNVSWLLLLPIVAFWGWTILNIDGWLVSSTHGMLGASRYRIFIPRLLLAVLIGFAIAEPLLLRIFQPAIEREVRDGRTQELVSYESLLRLCNPTTSQTVDPKQCKDYQIKSPPEGVQKKFDEAIVERRELKSLINEINGDLKVKEDLARAECNGRRGTGFSGIVGEGPNCERDRREADRFREDSKLQVHQTRLVSLNKRIVLLTDQLGNAAQKNGQEINNQISAKVNERRSHQREIGILEEVDALGRLSSRSTFVFATVWLLRSLLIVIDCLPILSKLMSGTTTYDRLLSRQLTTDEDLHEMDSRLRRRRDTSEKEVELQQIEYDVRTRIEKIAEADRVSRAQQDAELDAQIDALAARLLRQNDEPERETVSANS